MEHSEIKTIQAGPLAMNRSRIISDSLQGKDSRPARDPEARARLTDLVDKVEGTATMNREEILEQYRGEREQSRREAARFVAQKQAEARQVRVDRKFGHAGMPQIFRGQSLDDFEVYDRRIRRVIDVAKRYAERFDKSLERGASMTLVGIPGTGKTRIACAVLERVMLDGYIGVYSGMADMLRAFRGSYNGSKTEQETLDYFVEPDLLVLDDVGFSIGRLETTRSILFDVFDHRYREGKPTILVANLTSAELEDYLGERIFRRVTDGGVACLACDWTPYRERQE